jgi:hypothetical protein
VFFSADSNWLGLLTRDQLKKVSLEGGAQVTGDPVPVVSDATMESLFGQVQATASDDGLIAYVPRGRSRGRLAWVDLVFAFSALFEIRDPVRRGVVCGVAVEQ